MWTKFYIGRYGGNTESGAHKNEDGLLVCQSISWEFSSGFLYIQWQELDNIPDRWQEHCYNPDIDAFVLN